MILLLLYRSSLTMSFTFLFIFIFCGNLSAECKDWSGKLNNDKKINCEDINKWLEDHQKGLKRLKRKIDWGKLNDREAGTARNSIPSLGSGFLNGADLTGVDLSDANLEGSFMDETNLFGAKLARASLEGAYLRRVKLKNAMLREINAKYSILRSLDLSESNLKTINFSGSVFKKVDLKGTKFIDCNLSAAIFTGSELAGSEMLKSDLTGTQFEFADMTGVIYEPKSPGQPDIQMMSTAKNLHLMKYNDDRAGLVSLRKSFQENGYREKELDITYALRKRDREKLTESGKLSKRIDGYLNIILFEWTCEYGRKPGRPLILMSVLIIICCIAYFFSIYIGGMGTVWKVLPQEHQLPHEKDILPAKVEFRSCTVLENVWYPLFLSLLAAFRIGWRELNVGTWLSRTMPFEYTLITRGWVKIIMGMQSVISVYLLALSILTYFGRPFV